MTQHTLTARPWLEDTSNVAFSSDNFEQNNSHSIDSIVSDCQCGCELRNRDKNMSAASGFCSLLATGLTLSICRTGSERKCKRYDSRCFYATLPSSGPRSEEQKRSILKLPEIKCDRIEGARDRLPSKMFLLLEDLSCHSQPKDYFVQSFL